MPRQDNANSKRTQVTTNTGYRIAGALFGAGWAGVGYSVANSDEAIEPGEFWGGYVSNIVVGAAVGFFVGAASAALSAAGPALVTRVGPYVGMGLRLLARGLVGSGATVLDQLAFNGIQRGVLGRDDVKLSDGLGLAAVTGATFAVAGGLADLGLEKVTERTMCKLLFGKKFAGWSDKSFLLLWTASRAPLGLSTIMDAMNMVVAVEAPGNLTGADEDPRKS